MLKVIESNFSCTSPIQPPEQNSNSLWHTSFGVVTWKYLAKFLFFNLLWTQYSVKEEMCLLLYGATIVSCSFSLNQVWVTRKQDPGTVVFVFLHFCFFSPALYCHNPFYIFVLNTLWIEKHCYILFNLTLHWFPSLCSWLPFFLLVQQVAVCLNTAVDEVCRYLGNFQSCGFL